MSLLAAALLLAPPAAGPPQAVGAPAEELTIAMTRSGVQVEAVERPERGALEVRTPAGVFRTPTDPVEIVLHRPPHDAAGWADLDAADLPGLARSLSADGRLSELASFAAFSLDSASPAVQIEAFEALESWGAKLDPVPPKIRLDERVDWLWRELRRADPGRRALLAGRVGEEAVRSAKPRDRQVSLRELRRGIEDRDPVMRRATARVIGAQTAADLTLMAKLIEGSLTESLLVRDGMARGAIEAWPDAVLDYWWHALARGEDSLRRIAAEQLARFGGERAVDYLATVLSAQGRRNGRRYEFDGRDIKIKSDTAPIFVQLNRFVAHETDCSPNYVPVATTPDFYSFDEDAVLAITPPSEAVTRSVVRALESLTGSAPGARTPEDWSSWYENGREDPEQPAITPGKSP